MRAPALASSWWLVRKFCEPLGWTLQRRLTVERLTFESLVEEARREMAQHDLLQSALELTETAHLLGYEDPNSFIRAFHQWEGTSPGEWRSAHSAA